MKLSKRVVVRFLTGVALEGELLQFDPVTNRLKLRIDSEVRDVDCSVLKAIFFLRPPDTKPLSESFLMPAGKKVRVRFADGEEIDGYTYGLRPLEDGFYLFPINRNDRNERIYVIKKNAIQIRTEEK
ncbi:MAG: hypothetical protein HY203_06445 [Nitrospirae bacterium]|nr:hypothetical protein [Nitrospirota bacterium]